MELLTVIAVVALLLVAGVPTFAQFIAGQRATATINELMRDTLAARTEAARSGDLARIQPVDGKWESGWEVVARLDPVSRDYAMLKQTDGVSSGVELAFCDGGGNAISHFEFSSLGQLSHPASGARMVIVSRIAKHAVTKELYVHPNGRAETRTLNGESTCSGAKA